MMKMLTKLSLRLYPIRSKGNTPAVKKLKDEREAALRGFEPRFDG